MSHTPGRTSDQSVADAATRTTHNKHKRRTSMPSAKCEPTIPEVMGRQTYALDRPPGSALWRLRDLSQIGKYVHSGTLLHARI